MEMHQFPYWVQASDPVLNTPDVVVAGNSFALDLSSSPCPEGFKDPANPALIQIAGRVIAYACFQRLNQANQAKQAADSLVPAAHKCENCGCTFKTQSKLSYHHLHVHEAPSKKVTDKHSMPKSWYSCPNQFEQ